MAEHLMRLSRQQSRRLEDFILAHRDDIEKDRPTMQEFADKASKEIGFPISKYSVKLCSSVVGVKWPRPKREGYPHRKVRGVHKLIATIAEAQIQMMRDYGYATDSNPENRRVLVGLVGEYDKFKNQLARREEDEKEKENAVR